MTGFKNFLLRGNLVELAVAFIMAAVVRRRRHAPSTCHGPHRPDRRHRRPLQYAPSGVSVGFFINALIAFVIMAAVVYFFVVLPYTKAKERYFPAEDTAPRPTWPCSRRSATCCARATARSDPHDRSSPDGSPAGRAGERSAVVRRHLVAVPVVALARASRHGADAVVARLLGQHVTEDGGQSLAAYPLRLVGLGGSSVAGPARLTRTRRGGLRLGGPVAPRCRLGVSLGRGGLRRGRGGLRRGPGTLGRRGASRSAALGLARGRRRLGGDGPVEHGRAAAACPR